MNEINVFCLTIDRELTDEEFSLHSKLLSENRRAKLEKYNFIEDAQRTLLGEVLVRWAVRKHFNNNNLKNLTITRDFYGKPYFEEDESIHFNISHSGEMVLCSIFVKPIGVDVERVKENNLNIVEKYFTQIEKDYIYNRCVKDRLEAFYEIWTLKESYVKAIGKGLNIPLNSFSTIVKHNEIEIIHPTEKSIWKAYSLEVCKGYKAALCVQSTINNLEINTIFISIDELMMLEY